METVTRECPGCRQPYEADPRRLRHGRQTTCSRVCSYLVRARQRAQGEMIPCASCLTLVYKAPSVLARLRHNSVFCSPACHYAGRSAGLTGRVVTRPYVYTSEGRAALLAAVRRPKGKRVLHLLTCLNCGTEFDDPNDGRERKSGMTFCTTACCNAYRTGANNPAWRGGHPAYYGPDWRALRRAAWKRDDYTCRRCGKDMRPPARRPDVHHIIPVARFAEPNDANYIMNVVSLCKRCHAHCEHHGIDFKLPWEQ